MNHVNLLCQTLKPHLQWHGARLSFLALFLIALFRVKTVNLSDLSTSRQWFAAIAVLSTFYYSLLIHPSS